MSDSNYGFLDRLLHRLALQYTSIAEMSFDVDQRMVPADRRTTTTQRHVFVSGLARAGTTVLMRKFHATGLYRSLTYRDMPFVLAPNLWRRMSGISKKEIDSVERAHGDNVLVNADSPESFDEVFWRTFCGDEYLSESYLKPHAPTADVVQKYIRYVNVILYSDPLESARYLSKNNNNILRLGTIRQAFPNAVILIPFREPLQHALSLLRQHLRFSTLQATNKFALSYMTWLGHHEFGLDHRPFRSDDVKPSAYATESLDYWLELWCRTYTWLEESKPASALFVCYEDLCADEETWPRLATLAEIPANPANHQPFRLSERPVDMPVDQDLAERARTIYSSLVAQARERPA